ncbi:AraC family transcriptional regulator [Burkholderia ubonensis]|uniref:AraC family transcriptional regulator n=1 Tax=Burkholderia ubonensis TaxID=101571 RepID=UPI000A0FA1EB|nr:AraC family transcriptional regulator [Burkholderia ubonensis]
MDPLVRSSGLRGYPALMRDMGHDPVPLLRRYHIAEASLDQDDALISLRSATHLLEASAAVTGCGDFGLRLSSHQSIDVLGPLSIVLRNAPTIRDALNDLIRYLFVHSPGIVVSVDERSPVVKNTVAISILIRLSGPIVTRQNSDLCLADAHNFLRLFAGDKYDLRAVSIPHEPVISRAVYERFFGARLLAEPVGATLYIARDTFSANVQGANAAFRQIAEDYIFRNFGAAQGSVSDRVRQVLRQTLGASSCDKSSVAALLALHPRTLQRRLSDEGTCFETIKDEVRQQLAVHYLQNTRLTIGQISMMLGYPAQSALSRACHQWFALTPSDIRSGNQRDSSACDGETEGQGSSKRTSERPDSSMDG